jgi:hypothetical protein
MEKNISASNEGLTQRVSVKVMPTTKKGDRPEMLTFYERMQLSRAEEALQDEQVRRGYERLAYVLLHMDEVPTSPVPEELEWR